MKISKADLLARIEKMCPAEVEISITTPARFIEDIKIYGLQVPRSELDVQLLDYLKRTPKATVNGVMKRFNTTSTAVVDILEELNFLPHIELRCFKLKPEMGELGCDAILATLHTPEDILSWLGDLNKEESKYCTDLEFKAEQIQNLKWFAECPNCYCLRLIDFEKLPTIETWSKSKQQRIHLSYGSSLRRKYNTPTK
jgi:hypothetical protein